MPCLVCLLYFTPGDTVNAKRSWRCSSRASSWRSSLHHRILEEVILACGSSRSIDPPRYGHLVGSTIETPVFFFLLTAHRMCIHHVTVDFCTNIYTSTGPPSFCCYDYLCMRPIRDFAWILPRFTLGKRYSAATSLVSHVLCRVRCQKLGKTLGRQ